METVSLASMTLSSSITLLAPPSCALKRDLVSICTGGITVQTTIAFEVRDWQYSEGL